MRLFYVSKFLPCCLSNVLHDTFLQYYFACLGSD
uniref:Uncharacterized protein n=1 Tax=Anguilla anguilla TaxID=7936 RepID=A0A0E9UQ99_ANGAN